MERLHYDEMVTSFREHEALLRDRELYLFGHCEASLTLTDLLLEHDLRPKAILDNSEAKYGQHYKEIPVVPPRTVLNGDQDRSVVLIVTRFYEAMNAQLRALGFKGEVLKLVDYNTYAEYSLSEETRERKLRRVRDGQETLGGLKAAYPGTNLIFCPFNALGDIYFCMSYLPNFLKRKGVTKFVICVPSEACASVTKLFGAENVAVLPQKQLDAAIQAVIYTQDEDCYIAHQDRPYVVNLHKVLKRKRIPLEKVYCCGVFGLPENTVPTDPTEWKDWDGLDGMEEGRSVILSPYAKSVTALPAEIWESVVADYTAQNYRVYTNVSGKEEALPGTVPLHAELSEMKSILEKAGTFIGIRSGLCDVIRTAECRKIALYPDYNYCDTKWKSIDMYAIEGFDNIVVRDGDTWEQLKSQIKN